MKPSLREVLAHSGVAAISIAVLLLYSLDMAFRALWIPLSRLGVFLITALAIRDIPYHATTLTWSDRMVIAASAMYLYAALAGICAAISLSRWVFGIGPLQTLINYRNTGKSNNA